MKTNLSEPEVVVVVRRINHSLANRLEAARSEVDRLTHVIYTLWDRTQDPWSEPKPVEGCSVELFARLSTEHHDANTLHSRLFSEARCLVDPEWAKIVEARVAAEVES